MLLLTFNTIHGYTTSKSLNPWFRHFQIQSDEWIKSQYTHTYIHTDSEFTIADQNSRKRFFSSRSCGIKCVQRMHTYLIMDKVISSN